jgi:ABC-type transport system substrate-binding protein
MRRSNSTLGVVSQAIGTQGLIFASHKQDREIDMNMQLKYNSLAAATISLLLTLDTVSKAQAAPPFIFALRRTEPVTTLDYIDAQFTENLVVEAEIMEGLVGFDPQDEHLIVPRLAKSYHRIDLYTYVFRLRDDVYFHSHLHGQESLQAERVTPEDVVFSLLRAKSSPSAQQYKLDNVESIKTVGRDLVKIKLTRPDENFLSSLATAMGHVTCKGYYESLGSDDASRKAAFARAPVGTGPFYLARPLVDGRSIMLVRFDRYRDQDWIKSRAAIKRIEYRYYDSAADVLAGLERGDIGSASLMLSTFGEGGFLDPKKPPRFGGVYRLAPPFLSLLAINLTKPELADPLIRELLNVAVNRAKIEQICPQGPGDLPAGYRYYLEISKRYLQTKQASVLTLRQSRQVQERLRALQKRPFILLVRAGEDVTREQIVKSVVDDLKTQLQLDVRIVRTNQFPAELEASKPSYDLVYVDWTPDTPSEREGLSILYPLFYSQSRTNISHFSNHEVDELFLQLQGVVDKGAAENLYSRIQARLLENPPHIWLPSVRSNTLLYGRGYRSRIRPSSLVYYSSFLKHVERLVK